MREFKVGDKVIIIKRCEWFCISRYRKGKPIEKELAIITNKKYDKKENCYYYALEIIKCLYKNECSILRKHKICTDYMESDELKSLIDHLKFKKWIKG